MRKLLLVLALFAATTYAAEENLRPFQHAGPIHQISVSTSASTGLRIVPTSTNWNGCTQYKLENLGSEAVYVGFGASASAAQTNAADIPAPGDTGVAIHVGAGTTQVVTSIPNAWVSAKTTTATSTLNVGCGTGHLTASGGGGGGGGGTGTGGSTQVEGLAAHDAPVSGNPVRIGVRARTGSGLPVVGNDDTVDLVASTSGIISTVYDSTGADGSSNVAAGRYASGSGAARALDIYGYAFNGVSWDRIRTATGDNLAATGILAAGNMLWDGATWDRAPGNNNGAIVQGLGADGTAGLGSTNPIMVGGKDGGGNGQMFSTFTDGALNIVPTTPTGSATDPCAAGAHLKSSAVIDLSGTGTTQLVALTSFSEIYVCGFNFTLNGTAPTARFVYGTGANCGTGTTNLTGAMAPTVGLNLLSAGGGYTVFQANDSSALCITLGGTTPNAQGVVTYVKKNHQ